MEDNGALKNHIINWGMSSATEALGPQESAMCFDGKASDGVLGD